MMKKLPLYSLLFVAIILLLAACGGSEDTGPAATPTSVGDAPNGETLFNQGCIACHGQGGIGIEGLGKDMTTSDFIRGMSDDEFLAFVKVGRPVGDPLNTTGVDMPPKGGNPALDDTQILDIIAYIRTLQQ